MTTYPTRFASVFMAVLMLLAGCQTASTVTELLLPTVVCKVIQGKPASEGYVRALSNALEKFTASGDLSSASFRAALVSVPISGVKPHEASAIYGALVLVYSSVGEQFLTDPANKDQVLASLRSLQGGLAAGLSQCGSADAVVASAMVRSKAAHQVSKADVQKLADAMAAALRR